MLSKNHKNYALATHKSVKCSFSKEDGRCNLVYEGNFRGYDNYLIPVISYAGAISTFWKELAVWCPII